MSHTPTVFSPPGTPLPDRTVGEIVAERPSSARVFQSFNLDFCCQGNRTLREACERKNIPLTSIVEQLEAGMREPEESGDNPALLPTGELVDYIVNKHHQYLKDELPRIHMMAHRVANVHGGYNPKLIELYNIFCDVAEELEDHMVSEEHVLFPAIRALASGEKAGPIDGPVTAMMQEHDDHGEKLLKMRELTNDYIAPPEACNTYRALFAGLVEMEEDLHRHIHLENSVLFPDALALSKGEKTA